MFTFLTKSKLITYLNISWQNSAEIIFISACWSIDGLADFLNMVLPQPVTYPVLSWTSSSLSGKQTGWICFLKVTGRSNLIRAISLLKFFGWKSLFTLISSMSKSSCSKGSFVALAFQSPRNHPYFTSAKGLGWVKGLQFLLTLDTLYYLLREQGRLTILKFLPLPHCTKFTLIA